MTLIPSNICATVATNRATEGEQPWASYSRPHGKHKTEIALFAKNFRSFAIAEKRVPDRGRNKTGKTRIVRVLFLTRGRPA